MIRFRPSPRLAVLALTAAMMSAHGAAAQQAITTGGVLTGELHALRNRDASGKHVATFQLVSPPRRLPGPNGLCNLETGPETFQIVTTSEAEAKQLKAHLGKQVSIRANEMTCAELAGQMSDAIVSRWSLVTSN